MSVPEVLTPAQGSRIVRDDSGCVLFGQPPEVLKGLLLNNITSFDTLVLTDINYYLRKQRIGQENSRVNWLLEHVEIN